VPNQTYDRTNQKLAGSSLARASGSFSLSSSNVCMTAELLSPTKPSTKSEIVGVQYLRGIAALLVLVVHSDHMLGMEKYFGVSYIGPFANGGNLGVDLFFVISGFIIFYITDGFSPKTNSKAFLWRRFLRIIPFMWLCIIAVYVLRSAVRGMVDPIPFVRGFLLFPVGDVDPNTVWTLRHELFFYLFVFTCLAYRRGYLALLTFLLLPIPLYLFQSQTGYLESELLSKVFNVRANTSFAAGILIAWLYRKGHVWHRAEVGVAVVLSAPVVLLCFEYFVAQSLVPVGNIDPEYALGPTALIVASRCVLATFVCSWIVYASLSCVANESRLHEIGMVLGNASYSIYLTHETVISFVGILFTKLKLNNYGVIAGLASIALAIVMGTMVHYRIEKPLIAFLRKRYSA
jgi:exopolysaccharide production protein ExoZ